MRRPAILIGCILLFILFLLIVVLFGVNTPTGQRFITGRVNSYLEQKLNVPFKIDRIAFKIPDWVVLEGIYIPDLKQDTLVSGKRLYVDLDMWDLLQGNVGINAIEAEDIRARIVRNEPDTTFNYQFLVNAFSSPTPATNTIDPSNSTEPLQMRLDKIQLKNVFVTYQDDAAGLATHARIPDGIVKFDAFNASLMKFHPSDIQLQGASVVLHTYQPKITVFEPIVPVDPNDTLDIAVGSFAIKNFAWTYQDDVAGIKNGLSLGSLEGRANKIYLKKQFVGLKNISINQLSTFVNFQPTTPPPTSTPADTITAGPGWSVALEQLTIQNSDVEYDDWNSKPIAKGLDYAHIQLKNITTKLNDLHYSEQAITGHLKELSLNEKSGFQVRSATTKFGYTATETFLKDFSFVTPSTSITTDLQLKYTSLAQLSNQLDKVQLNVDLQESKLGFKDILLLAPDLQNTSPFNTMPTEAIKVAAKLKGSVGNLAIEKAIFSIGESTVANVTGKIVGLPTIDKLNLDLQLHELKSSSEDIKRIIPADVLPADITIPSTLALRGHVSGSMQHILLDAQLTSSAGRASIDAQLSNLTKPETLIYQGNLAMDSLQLGHILNMSPQQLGSLSLSVTAEGQGIDPSTMTTSIKGVIKQASFQNYNYHNLVLDGQVENGLANFQAKIEDPNIKLNFTGQTNLTKEYPDLKVDALIDELQLQPLNLYPEQVGLKGRISADFSSLNPANPLGSFSIQNLTVLDKQTPISIGNIVARLSESETGSKTATIDAPFMTARMNGNYSYTELADVISHEISKYFNVDDSTSTSTQVAASRFRFHAKAFYHPVIKVFAPKLTRMDTITLAARVDNQIDTSMLFRVIAPFIEYDSMRIDRVRMGVAGTAEKAFIRGSLGHFSTSGFRIRKVGLEGDMANNEIKFDFTVKDSLDQKRHGISGLVAIDDKRYRFGLTKEALLNYVAWQPASNGVVTYSDEGLLVQNFGITNKNGEQLRISSVADSLNAPIRIQAQNIQIGPLVTMFLQDSTLAKGTLNTDMRIRNYMDEHIIFGGSLDVKDLHMTQIPLGDLSIRATNRDETRIQMLSTLKSDDNDLTISGNYLPAEKEPLDLKIAINKLAAKTIEAFSFGELTQSKGHLNGNLLLKGATDKPALAGQVKFNQVAFRVNQLGATYNVPTSQLAFNGQTINFNDFIVTDNLNQELKVNGSIDISSVPDVGYNITINTRNFTALNSTRSDNDMFYGKGIVNADLSIKGKGAETIINGDVKLISGSNITVIMPDDATAANGEGIVEFIKSDSPNSRTLVTTVPTDSVKNTEIPTIGFASEMNLNIEADDKSEFTIIVDELNGDQLKVKGNAQLNTGISPNGQLFLLGLYELTEGAYDLSLEVLKKQFIIRRGSKMLWTGDPMKADIDITAVYPINADLSQLSTAGKEFGKTPLNVLLKIEGNLTAPVIKFEIEPQSDILSRNVVSKINDNVLTQLNNNSSEVNKQAFALLVMNRFISEQSGSSSAALNAEGIARQSVSQLLSDQLNLLASDLVKGVNLNFDLNSSNESGKARTDLNVGLSKGFLDDRLTIAVGRNFEIENQGKSASSTEIFDNISVNYALTRDGRYMVRAYRKNQFQTVLEGYVIETGVSFVVTMDYDSFREIFQKNAGSKNEK